MSTNTNMEQKQDNEQPSRSIFSFLKRDKTNNSATESLKEAVDAYLEETSDQEAEASEEETQLLTNVLSLRDMDVTDVMIPRVDIVAVEVSSSVEDLLSLLIEKQYSRLPVFKETLDEILGTIHIKDILAKLAKQEPLDIKSLIRAAPIVSPAMPILDLVQLMRQQRRHMVLVVDEYGGIDGLVTIGDIIEEVLGEIDDEYDIEEKAEIEYMPDGSVVVDARVYLDDLEKEIERQFDPVNEDDENDTVGGLISSLAGRLPARGEIIDSPEIGVEFKILDSDPRKIKRVALRLYEPNNDDGE